MDLSVQENKFKIDFQDSNCGGNLVFPIGTIFAIFVLQVTLMLSTKFRVSWPFSSGEEALKISKIAVMEAILDFRSE